MADVCGRPFFAWQMDLLRMGDDPRPPRRSQRAPKL
jgi:hypothetical protein